MNRMLHLFSVSMFVLALGWNYATPEKFHSAYAVFVVLYFYVSTFFVHKILLKANAVSAQNFVRTFMLFTAIRLFLNLLIVAVYMLVDRSNAVTFVLAFLFFYFCFLIFDIFSLQKQLRNK